MPDADDVERHPCPRCQAQPGSPCRSHSGAVAGTYHTGRFTTVPRLAKLLRVPTPCRPRPRPALASRHPGARSRRPVGHEVLSVAGADVAIHTRPIRVR
ncbi:zinc finger domain-containing protein [Streptomyces platensis]|uniref:zinc finger domain-containing protein n=1 Tax=Streptomyces platensis TaxID=58346 RepID=UPI003F60F6F0